MLDNIDTRLNEYEKKIESLTQTISELKLENRNLQIKDNKAKLIVAVNEYVRGIEYKNETNDFNSEPTFFV